ncbi:hypothetical protein ACHAW6_014312 [Cyclotella cf. meneghiniana]
MINLVILLLAQLTTPTRAFYSPVVPSSCRVDGLVAPKKSCSSERSRRFFDIASLERDLHLHSCLGEDLGGDFISSTKAELEASLTGTDRGRSASPSQKDHIHSLISKLESLCPLSEPARDPRMDGPWVVLYTDAPPPSNGQLLLWRGIAKQVIDLEGGRYRNELYIGGSGDDEDKDPWLKAVLDASWEEWDGVYLDGSGGRATFADYGASTWKVTFERLSILLLGLPIFTQQFKEGTARTWKMTFLDDNTRVVRAGKTGKEDDDWLFYMRRGI